MTIAVYLRRMFAGLAMVGLAVFGLAVPALAAPTFTFKTVALPIPGSRALRNSQKRMHIAIRRDAHHDHHLPHRSRGRRLRLPVLLHPRKGTFS
jgi:hypothetical protein